MSHLRKLWIEGPTGRLEALLRVACPARGAAVVAHPHPSHGGTMHNPVVFHVDRALHAAGLTTLRFNFRGVGASDGQHDGGRGEVEDVAAAAVWLRGVALQVPLLLVGYSFGGVCALRHAPRDATVSAVIAIGLPVRLFAPDFFRTWSLPLRVLQGSEDELGAPAEVTALLGGASGARVEVIPGAGHLLREQAREVGTRAVAAVHELLGWTVGDAAVS